MLTRTASVLEQRRHRKERPHGQEDRQARQEADQAPLLIDASRTLEPMPFQGKGKHRIIQQETMTTHEQRQALIAAVDAGDDVRAVTIALQMAASKARAGDTSGAMSIRREVDRVQAEQHRQTEYRRMRLQIAAQLFAFDPNATPAGSVLDADVLIAANESAPVPGAKP